VAGRTSGRKVQCLTEISKTKHSKFIKCLYLGCGSMRLRRERRPKVELQEIGYNKE
jgi:hypothetical protein